MAGLLSTLDSVLNAPLPDLVNPLPIDSGFKRAILDHEGSLGALLDAVISYEDGRWEGGEDTPAMYRSFWDATGYARTMLDQLRTDAPQKIPA
jgi:EAL and modified HD-GYP domain-containing signal transduction protein